MLRLSAITDSWKLDLFVTIHFFITANTSSIILLVMCPCYHLFLNINFTLSNEHPGGGNPTIFYGWGFLRFGRTNPGYKSHLFFHDFMNCSLKPRRKIHTCCNLLSDRVVKTQITLCPLGLTSVLMFFINLTTTT